MNNYEIDNMIEQIEEYEAQNRIETLKVNLGTSDGDVIFSKEISSLNPEGKVEIQLDRWTRRRIQRKNPACRNLRES